MNRFSVNRLAAVSLLVSGGLLTIQAQAAGFYLVELGTPASLGTAGVANSVHTEGADTSWTNPAAMTYLKEEQMMAGVQVILPKVEFNTKSATHSVAPPAPPTQSFTGYDGGNAGEAAPVPSFFYVRPLSEEWRIGFSVAGTMGGGYDYGDNFVGRYAVKDVTLQGLAFTPSIGYRVNDKLSLGAGVSIINTIFEQTIAVRNDYSLSAPTPGSDGEAEFDDMDDWGYQGIFSLIYEFSDRAMLGVVYRTEMDVELEGDLRLTNVALLGGGKRKGDLDIDWTNPQWLDVAFSYEFSDSTKLAFNAGWQEWSEFSKNYITINPSASNVGEFTPVLDRNWDDTWYVGVAMAHKLSDKSLFTLGLSYDSEIVDDDDRTLDLALDETWKFSGAYAWRADKFDYSLGATLYVMGESKIDQTAQGVRVVGDFDTNAMLFIGGTMRYEF